MGPPRDPSAAEARLPRAVRPLGAGALRGRHPLHDPGAPRASARSVRPRPARAARRRARLWLLLNLELWQRIFLDGEDPADVRAHA